MSPNESVKWLSDVLVRPSTLTLILLHAMLHLNPGYNNVVDRSTVSKILSSVLRRRSIFSRFTPPTRSLCVEMPSMPKSAQSHIGEDTPVSVFSNKASAVFFVVEQWCFAAQKGKMKVSARRAARAAKKEASTKTKKKDRSRHAACVAHDLLLLCYLFPFVNHSPHFPAKWRHGPSRARREPIQLIAHSHPRVYHHRSTFSRSRIRTAISARLAASATSP